MIDRKDLSLEEHLEEIHSNFSQLINELKESPDAWKIIINSSKEDNAER